MSRTSIDALKDDIRELTGRKDAFCFGYGRTALLVALQASNVAGQRVLVPAFTCDAVVDAVLLAGAHPAFIDVDPETLELHIDQLKAALEEGNVGAVIVIHYFGWRNASLEPASELVRKGGVKLIEDSAHRLARCSSSRLADYTVYSLPKVLVSPAGGILVAGSAGAEAVEAVIRAHQAAPHSGSALRAGYLAYSAWLRYRNHVALDRLSLGPARCSVRSLIELTDELVERAGRRAISGSADSSSANSKIVAGSRQVPFRSFAVNRVSAFIAAREITKIDAVNARRRLIGTQLQERVAGSTGVRTLADPESDFSYFPLFLAAPAADQAIDFARRRGLLLRRAWAAHPGFP